MSDSTNLFEVFPWSESFTTGISLIDDQHKKLVALINKLASTMSETANEEILVSVFDELAAYAEYHFQTEEGIWKTSFQDDEWLRKHKSGHEAFLPAIEKIRDTNKTLPYEKILSEILRFLVNWLVYHILDDDKRMALVVIAMNEGMPIAQAKSKSNEEMSGLTKTLISTVLKMYENVALRSITLIRIMNEKAETEKALIESKAATHAANQVSESLQSTILAMVKAIEHRSPYTAGHQLRVANLVSRICEKLGLSESDTQGFYFSAMIHDIGDLYIPAEIISRPGTLESAERKIVEEHVKAGYDILKDIKFPWPIAEIIYQHHERLDGSGYPRGLKENEILLGAKIIAVADVVEAMSTHRPYRPAYTLDEVLFEIQSKKGIAYDNEVVEACVALFKEDGFTF